MQLQERVLCELSLFIDLLDTLRLLIGGHTHNLLVVVACLTNWDNRQSTLSTVSDMIIILANRGRTILEVNQKTIRQHSEGSPSIPMCLR